MKKLLLFLLLFSCALIQAQIVNFENISLKNHLIYFGHDTNEDGEIQISEALAVRQLSLDGVPITSLNDLEVFTNLTLLYIDSSIESMDVSVFPLLEQLYINTPSLTYLNLSGLNNLETLELNYVSLTSLDVSGLPGLLTLSIRYTNYLTELNFGYMPQLLSLNTEVPNLTSLDLSGCPNLNRISADFPNSNHDVYINLKNGNPDSGHSVYFEGNDIYKCYVCLDEGEIDTWGTHVEDIMFSTYCSFTPAGSYNTIAGALTFDADNNGCDVADAPMPFASVQINDGAIAGNSYSSSGIYNFYTQAGTFTLTPQFENNWFTAAPATVTFADNNNNTATQNFCVTANGVHNDVEVVIVSVIPAQPGFDAIYKVIYKNKGNQTLSGNVSFSYDDTVLDYVSASTAPSSSATGSLTWSYNNLLPFETRIINVTLNANGPMEIPAVNIDDVFNFTAAITPTTGDETPTDNVFALTQTVVGSYDPNDITCLEGATVSPDKIAEYLHYNINFENTGTAPATFIAVKDVIDTTKYDISTLQVLYASHPMQTRITGNKVEFYFGDINLGATEKGNVTFKIKTLETLTVNSNVTQQADIFFDYNWPIVTNEATTTFAILSTGDFVKDNSVTVSPNPSNGIVNIWAKTEIKSVQLYDVQGRLLQAANGTTIDVSNRAAGLYFVKVMTAKGMKVEKLVRE